MRVLGLFAILVTLAAPVRAATDVVEVVSPGGHTAWLVQETSIPMLALNLHFAGGASLDPADKAGATRLMVGLIEEGAGDLDRAGFARAADALSARFGFSAGRDGVSVGATMLTENRDASVDLLALALTAPRFDPQAIDLVRPQLLSVIDAGRKDPSTLAREAFREAAFGDHPYVRPVDGTAETVASLTRDDILDAHRRAFTRGRVTIAAVGDIDPQALGALLDDLLGDLPADGPPLPVPADTVDAAEQIVIPLDTPQSQIVAGHSGILPGDPDFLPAFVANHIFGGGGFSARLLNELREERGLTYGVSSTLSTARYGPLVLAGLSTANADAAQAIELLRAEWRRLAEEGVTEDELAAAKRFLTGAYPLQFDGNRRIASLLVGLQLGGRDLDYVARRNALIEALTLDQVNAAAARVFRPDVLRVVVVGQPEGVETSAD